MNLYFPGSTPNSDSSNIAQEEFALKNELQRLNHTQNQILQKLHKINEEKANINQREITRHELASKVYDQKLGCSALIRQNIDQPIPYSNENQKERENNFSYNTINSNIDFGKFSQQNEFQRKFENVKKLEKYIESLKNENAVLSSNVSSLENEAIRHQAQLDEYAQKINEIKSQRAEAERRKQEVLSIIAERYERRNQLLNQIDMLKHRREAAERERDRIDQEESQIKMNEIRMDDTEISSLDISLSPLKSRKTPPSSPKRSDGVDQYLSRFTKDAAELEIRFQAAEERLSKKKEQLAADQKEWLEVWKKKLETADQMIDNAARKLHELEGKDRLERKRNTLEEEGALLKAQLERIEADVANLRHGPGNERELLEEIEKETRSERERVAIIEHQLDDKLIECHKENDMLDAKMDELKEKKDVLDSRLKVLQLRENGARKMLDLYKQHKQEVLRLNNT